MKKQLPLILFIISMSTGYGQLEISTDVYSRYVWRGTDFGNAASIQPSMEYSLGALSVGVWGAWAINGAAGGNESDLYISSGVGPVSVTLTDYFFPAYSGNDGFLGLKNHIIEASASVEVVSVNVLAAYNLSGDDENSSYVELSYQFMAVGVGNGFYTVSDDPDWGVVNIMASASKGIYSFSYIINPEQETSFLVVGVSL